MRPVDATVTTLSCVYSGLQGHLLLCPAQSRLRRSLVNGLSMGCCEKGGGLYYGTLTRSVPIKAVKLNEERLYRERGSDQQVQDRTG